MNPIVSLDTGLFGLILTCVVLIAIPGPSIMFLIGQTLSLGRGHALRGVLGNALGTLSIAMVVAVGLGVLLEQSPGLMSVLRGLGALVLGGIGLRYLRPASWMAPQKVISTRKAQPFIAGLLVGASNPKALIIFGVIVPSFIHSTAQPVGTLLAYSLVPVVLGLVIDALWVCAAHLAGAKLAASQQRAIPVIGGCLMLVMAVMLLCEGLAPLFNL